jgi:hypothetical protein
MAASFITLTESVYCALRSDYILNIWRVNVHVCLLFNSVGPRVGVDAIAKRETWKTADASGRERLEEGSGHYVQGYI